MANFSKLSRKRVIFTTFLKNLLRLTLSAFINNQLSLENYAFTFDEIAEAYKDKAETSVNNDLKYATQKGDIIPLRHHFCKKRIK